MIVALNELPLISQPLPSITQLPGGGAGGGAGVGVGGAPPSATHNNALVSPAFKSEITFKYASSSICAMIAEDFMVGLPDRMIAAAPETCGHATEAPLLVDEEVSELIPADRTPLPGAQMFTHRP